MPENLIESVKNWLLNEYSIAAELEWMNGCIDFFKSENPNLSLKEMQNNTYEQWLLANLADACVPSLPHNIPKTIHKITGQFALQLLQILDVSESPYDQLNKLENKNLDAAEETTEFKMQLVKKKRMFKLELSDGHKTIIAMEYQPIKVLNSKLAPGTKILLIGPIRCVGQVLLLESKNIKILGGEVDTLLICNAYENALRKLLGKPINPKPNKDYKEVTISEESKNRIPISQQKNQNVKKPSQPMLKPTTASNNQKDSFGDFDDFEEYDIDLDAISKLTESDPAFGANQKNVSQKNDNINDIDYFNDDEDIEMFNAIEAIVRQEHENTRCEEMVCSSNSMLTHRKLSVDYNDAEMSEVVVKHDKLTMELTDEDSNLNNRPTAELRTPKRVELTPPPQPVPFLLPILEKTYKFRIEGMNLVTIDQLAKCNIEDKINKKFVFFAEVNSVSHALRIIKGEWHLRVLISDQSVNLLEIKVSSDVLTEISGYDAKELEERRKQMKNMPQFKTELLDILAQLKKNLETLHCFMQITIIDSDCMVLERIIKTKPNYMRILKNKIEQEHLLKLQQTQVSGEQNS